MRWQPGGLDPALVLGVEVSHIMKGSLVTLALLALGGPALIAPVAAQEGAPAEQEGFRAAIVVEPTTWTVLYQHQPHLQQSTASMIKMLNALVVMDAIEAGEITWATPVRASRKASYVEGSQVYLREGEVFTVRELLTAMMVKSANDAAAALAEAVGGSQEAFVERMRAKAKGMGLAETEVHTPHGLDTSETGLPEDRSSPWDLARMGAAVLEHPELRQLAGTRLAPFRAGEFELFNPNRLLGRYPYATGIKTGYHPSADFCVTASARREGMELIAVVMGADHRLSRFAAAERLLEDAFDRYRLVVPVHTGELLTQRAPVAGGRWSAVPVRTAADVRMVVPKSSGSLQLQRLVALTSQPAPVHAGDPVGRVVLRQDGRVIAEIPAVAAAEVPRARPWQLWRSQLFSTLLILRLALGM
jgi:serine-type D-Ala-D-Ala carboxypeptidase (penicillin-binding protein 5/6)